MLVKPKVLAGPCELTVPGGGVAKSTAAPCRAVGVRDLASGLAMVLAPNARASRLAIAVRVVSDLGDTVVFGTSLPGRSADHGGGGGHRLGRALRGARADPGLNQDGGVGQHQPVTNGGTAGDPDTAEVIRRELQLLDPEVRRSPQDVLELLHPDFVEFGASGVRWDASGIAAGLEHAAGDEGTIEAREVAAVRLAPDVVLLTFEAHASGRVSLRSSVWVRLDGRWRLRFHQGTAAKT